MLSCENKELLDLIFANEILLHDKLKVVISRATIHKKEMVPIRIGSFLIKYHGCKNNYDYLSINGLYTPRTSLALNIMVSDISDYIKLLEN